MWYINLFNLLLSTMLNNDAKKFAFMVLASIGCLVLVGFSIMNDSKKETKESFSPTTQSVKSIQEWCSVDVFPSIEVDTLEPIEITISSSSDWITSASVNHTYPSWKQVTWALPTTKFPLIIEKTFLETGTHWLQYTMVTTTNEEISCSKEITVQ